MTHNNSEPLDGVKCIVNTCHYHLLGDMCGANKLRFNHEMPLIQKKLTVQPLDQMIDNDKNQAGFSCLVF